MTLEEKADHYSRLYCVSGNDKAELRRIVETKQLAHDVSGEIAERVREIIYKY